MALVKVGANLLDFIYNNDFANILVQLISSKDFAKLILISKEFKKDYILPIIKHDYEKLYFEFICERELVYPLIFSHHFVGLNATELSKLLATQTMANLYYNMPLSHIVNKDLNFNPHDKSIRRILYQCFSLYLFKTKRIVHSDGSISFDDVGSIIYFGGAIIDTNGEWADTYDENDKYSKSYEFNIIYKEDGSIDTDNSMLKYDYNDDGELELDRLGSLGEDGMYIEDEFYNMYINPLFMLLHKFCIKLKNKLIIDRIVISPFEKEINIIDICENIRDIINTHHINCFYGNIEKKLEIEDDFQMLDSFYTFVASIPIEKNFNDDLNKLVYSLIMNRSDIMIEYNQLQPHNHTMKYDTKGLLDYLPVQDWPKF